ncbi:hypothetical protein LIER_41815 [Lithospermum erythrorhizon]|uniref:Endonuclease/exonuclease/phosphatase domain-containing protein n=1 Tax=Lithospermum erythrorhizon TaxID=34254 RepID=A0AAV3RGK5_LITER
MLIKEDQYIIEKVHGEGKNCADFMLSAVYGSNNRGIRMQLWASRREAGQNVGCMPLVVGGDFNIIRAVSESVGGGRPEVGAIDEFNCCVKDCELVEHPHTGSQFSWCRNWKDRGVLGVLDRVLCNHNWFTCFSASEVDVPTPTDSDHYSLNITVKSDIPQEPRPFKYQPF